MGDRVPNHMMFQYMMWYEEQRDPLWMKAMDRLSFKLPKGTPWPIEP